MKPLNRPMFRYGGPIKEGIMSGIREPRQGYKLAGKVDRTVGGAQMVFPAEITSMMPNDASKVFANVAQTYQPIDSNVNTTDRYITVERRQPRTNNIVTQEIENPDFIPKYKTVRGPRIGERKVEITEDMENITGKASGTEMPPMLDQSGKMGAGTIDKVDATKDNNENNNLIDTKDKKTRVNEILSSLGYDRAQKNALYDAMIKAGQRISRTGLGAENLVSDVIAETSQSYDKPEKLREAANLLAVQQEFDIEKIKKQNELKKNPYEEKEAYLTKSLGDADLAKRISVGSPKNIIEAAQIVEKAGIRARSDKGVDATLSIYFDGINVPKYKGELSETNTETLIKLKGDKTVQEFKGTTIGDIDDGVYKLGKGYVDIRDGKIFDVREIISSFIEE